MTTTQPQIPPPPTGKLVVPIGGALSQSLLTPTKNNMPQDVDDVHWSDASKKQLEKDSKMSK